MLFLLTFRLFTRVVTAALLLNILMVSLPTTLFESVSDDCVISFSKDAEQELGSYEGAVVGMPPQVLDAEVSQRAVLFHPSVISQFPADFREFSARVESDRCMLLDFCPSDKSLPIIYMCFLSFPFNLVSGAFS